MKRTYSESTALPNLPGVTSGSGLKRAHEKSSANDGEEQHGTRARISTLIAGLHGVDTAEDDEICSGDEVPDEWLSSWYPETHMSQKMVIEATRKEMERFKTNEGVPCCHKRIHEKGRRRKNDQHQMGHHKQRDRRAPNCQGTSGSTRVQHLRPAW